MDDRDERVVRSANPFSISPKIIIALVVLVLIAITALSCFFVVDQTEQAVILRMGQYQRTVGPGLQTKMPFGIEKAYNIPTQVVQTLTFGYRANDASGTSLKGATSLQNESLMLTGDLNIVDVEWIVQYKINDPKNWLFKVQNRETTIRDISQSVMNELVGDLPILSVMTNLRTQIEIEAQEKMQKIFDRYEFGIQIVTVKLQNIVPPKGSVQDAFEDVNKAIQDMNRLINEGKEYYNKEIPSAQGESSKMILQAKGYAAERVNEARGDADRFDSVREAYEESPDITKTRLYLETMNEVLTEDGGKLTIIDSKLENFLPVKNMGGAL
ncbi:MAG: FtsH protease activity modulator HflK [Sphaerochaetaceae bacterium]|nr:FtsH protease activity modulator HflK [Sphaerochaetaceae bacterium]